MRIVQLTKPARSCSFGKLAVGKARCASAEPHDLTLTVDTCYPIYPILELIYRRAACVPVSNILYGIYGISHQQANHQNFGDFQGFIRILEFHRVL